MDKKESTAAIHGAKKGRHVLGKLSARFVQTVKFPPKWHSDGGGLYLRVTKDGNKAWVFTYPHPRKAPAPGKTRVQREMGIGSYPVVSLEEARRLADRARQELRDGIDPIEKKKAAKQAAAFEQAKTMTFDECATAYIKANRAGWKNDKHAGQWEATLATYASPIIGKLPVADIDKGLVLKVLEPIWSKKPETASRLRGRIEAILGWAAVHGYRTGLNPARWKDHLDKALPKRSKIAAVQHHPALPYVRIGTFMVDLRKQAGMGALALEFAILTAARSGEVRGATWNEIDMEARRWVIPADRMKAGKEHHIPLSDAATDLLKRLPGLAESELVFPAPRGGVLSDMTLTAVLRRMQGADAPIWTDTTGGAITAHGFRSAFRDWAGETTAYPREVIEHALAHQLKDKAEAAYQRGSLLDKRRRLMDDWAAYCNTTKKAEGGNVVAIGKSKTAA
jgi:integrase